MRHLSMLRALAAVLALFATQSLAQAPRPVDRDLPFLALVINHSTEMFCTGAVFGGTTVFAPLDCILDKSGKEIARLSVTPGVRQRDRSDGASPLPHGHYKVTRVFVTPAVAAKLGQEHRITTQRTDSKAGEQLTLLEVAHEDGQRPFTEVTDGISLTLLGGGDIKRAGYADRLELYGYSAGNASMFDVFSSTCDGDQAVPVSAEALETGCVIGVGMTGGPLIRKRDGVTIAFAVLGGMGMSYMTFVPKAWLEDLRRFAQRGGKVAPEEDRLEDLDYLVPLPAPNRRFLGLYLRNRCEDRVAFATHFKTLEDEWTSLGWYTVGPGETRRVPMETRNGIVYWTAVKLKPKVFERVDGHYGWYGEDWTETLGGIKAKMRKRQFETFGDELITLTCD
ncbi:MAG: hypothetical protein R3D85_17540 [Paracoccaceae bacterium]